MLRRLTNTNVHTILAALALVGAGCGDSRFHPTYRVSGQVLLDDKPVHGVTVQLIPKEPAKFKMDERPLGITDKEGRFELSTYYQGDGAPAGSYGVAIAYNPPGDGDDASRVARRPPVKIPPIYHVPQKSGLNVTIEAKDNQLSPFKLTSKGPR